MIVSAEFKNFRALRDLKIDLEPFTVIVGPNSCGKSTILEGLDRLFEYRSFTQNDISKGSQEKCVLSTQFRDNRNVMSEYTILESFRSISIDSVIFQENDELFDHFKLELGKSIILNPNTTAMARASYGASLNPMIDSDGRGLATVCANFHLEYPEYFERVQEQMRRVIPSLKRFRIRRAETTNYIGGHEPIGPAVFGDELVFDFENAPNIPANRVGGGILVSLCVLIVAMRISQEPFLLLIDNLERGLHPMTTQDLANALRDLQKEFPNLQIVATTHSTYLLDAFEVKEVRVTALDPQRGTVIACLSEAPDFEKWNAVLKTGELWSHMGEKWVLEQRHMDALVEGSI
jgi:predicted ATPase